MCTCECASVCACFSISQAFCIDNIIFEIEKNHSLEILLFQVTKPLPPIPLPPSVETPWMTLGKWLHQLGGHTLLLHPRSTETFLPNAWGPLTAQPRALRGPQSPGLKDATPGPAGRWAERPDSGWAEMVPRASVSTSASCHDAAPGLLPPSLGCPADSVTVGVMGPIYTGWVGVRGHCSIIIFPFSGGRKATPHPPARKTADGTDYVQVTNLSTPVAMVPRNAETAAASAALPGGSKTLPGKRASCLARGTDLSLGVPSCWNRAPKDRLGWQGNLSAWVLQVLTTGTQTGCPS